MVSLTPLIAATSFDFAGSYDWERGTMSPDEKNLGNKKKTKAHLI